MNQYDNCYLCLEPLTHPFHLYCKSNNCNCRWKTHIQCGLEILQQDSHCLLCRKSIVWTDFHIQQPIVNYCFKFFVSCFTYLFSLLQRCFLYERAIRYYRKYRRTIWYTLQLNTLATLVFYTYIATVYSLMLANGFMICIIIGLTTLFLFDLMFECSF